MSAFVASHTVSVMWIVSAVQVHKSWTTSTSSTLTCCISASCQIIFNFLFNVLYISGQQIWPKWKVASWCHLSEDMKRIEIRRLEDPNRKKMRTAWFCSFCKCFYHDILQPRDCTVISWVKPKQITIKSG